LQIAAHASANFENLERPLIYTELNNTDSVLYDIDLEQLNSNNTLTVFAACKSSVGYVQYNGVIDGFSRAVLSAGGSGTITALFNVEEHITVQTLNLFYQHLGEGLTASDALYLAKKEIKRKFSHPKKWQAFVYNGSSISFVSQSKTTNLSLLGLAMLVFVALTISLIKAEF
jgi:CHAT domain-containing protein